jgi:homoserine kinase type II
LHAHLWELTPWLPGQADYHRWPHPEKLSAALRALAEFHLASQSLPAADRGPAPAPGIEYRRQRLRELLQGGYQHLVMAAGTGHWPELERRARQLLQLFPRAAGFLQRKLDQAVGTRVVLQPCIRDIWHDHVLFLGHQVTGLVDFGAMRIDSVAADVARLLGSLAGEDRQRWEEGLRAYAATRPLTSQERELISTFDQCNVLLSGLNWLQWCYVEGREFDDPGGVIRRVDEHLSRLHSQWGGDVVHD